MIQMKKHAVQLFVAIVLLAAWAGAVNAASKEVVSGTINVNTASLSQLMQLPGIGKSKAQAIMDQRTASPFRETVDLKQVKGIGDKLFTKIEGYVTVSGPTTLTVQKAAKEPGATGKRTP